MVDKTNKEVFTIKAGEYEPQIRLAYKYIRKILPGIDRQLKELFNLYGVTGIDMPGRQGSSDMLCNKLFMQCAGFYALYPKVDMKNVMIFTISFQAISDYLNNLCTKSVLYNESAVRQLHLAMLDAVDPNRIPGNYSHYYPYKCNTDYLKKLVDICRLKIKDLPSYTMVIGKIKKYIQLYTDLQSYKNLPKKAREECLNIWSDYYIRQFPGISCWEFSASSDSTLGIYIMYASAFDPKLTTENVKAIDDAYFPWICGLQKLLASYIEAREDMLTDCLSFTDFYKNLKQCEERLTFFTERAVESCFGLQNPEFHLTVVKALLGMYLSDPRAFFGLYRLASRNLLANSSSETRLYWNTCRILRSAAVLR